MATTVQEILLAAYSKSAKNRPGHIASESTELLQVVVRALRGLFADGVKFNQKFYARRASVAYDGTAGGWPRPDAAEAIVRIELPNGKRVAEVPFDDREAEKGLPSVYGLGQVFYSAGNTNDPVSGNLVMFYSARPRDLTDLEADPEGTLDPNWPEQFNELLILEVAIYLATKEGNREAEVQALQAEYQKWYTRYTEFLMHETTTLVRRYGHDNRINTQGVNT